MTERPVTPERPTPSGWPPPERIDAIMEIIRRRIAEYMAETDARVPRETGS